MTYLICGIDEVGRGALAGPLFAVAALFNSPPGEWELSKSPIDGINDSKKLKPEKRVELFHKILNFKGLIDFGIGEASVREINSKGIDWANELAFKRALGDISRVPDHVIIDGKLPVIGWNPKYQTCEPKADANYWPVSAASILAKVIRDRYMAELGTDNPQYKWNSNSGYGSKAHKQALKEFGACGLHRKQFVGGLI
jgi:ribonuclease HII